MAIDTTVAGTDSNSYITLAEAKAALFGPALTAWNNLSSNEEREAYVKRAASIIEMQNLAGEKSDSTQALFFPRTTDYTLDDDDEEVYFIPPTIKKVQYAQVSYLLLNEGFTEQSLEYRAKGIRDIGLGPGATASFARSRPSAKDFLSAEARALLAPYFSHPTIRVERA